MKCEWNCQFKQGEITFFGNSFFKNFSQAQKAKILEER